MPLNPPPRPPAAAQLSQLHELDLSRLSFVGDALTALRSEVGGSAAVLGFVGSPWTLATYLVEGASSSLYKTIKSMAHAQPALLEGLLSRLADGMAEYMCYQIEAGAQVHGGPCMGDCMGACVGLGSTCATR
jgi:uroporphyrinogen decarboxylase